MSVNNPFDALLNISEEISNVHDISELLERIIDIAIGVLSAERGFILLKSPEKKKGFEAVAARNINSESIANIRQLSSSVVNQVLKKGEAVLTFDAQADERFSAARSVVLQKIRSIACTPLINHNEVTGAIYMDSLTAADQFTDETLQFLEAFARQAAIAIENARMFEQLQSENQQLKRHISLQHLFPEIIGESREIKTILETIMKVANAKAAVFIEGESGTGKELVARALHYHSSRKDKLFIPVFCGSLADNLLESELFGHKKGAFTGAIENKAGLFEEADGGTIFLDEIGDIDINTQTKLLRVIQEGEIKPVGETKIKKVNVRVVSATNKDLWKEVQENRFREDLYYRLNVISIKMPPLRERGNDILILAKHFLERFAKENGKKISDFTPSAIQALQKYPWPGNIRELENAVERAVIMTDAPTIPPELFNLSRTKVNNLTGKSLKEIEKTVILETLEMTGQHRARTAEILGVSKRWLQYRIKEWGMDRD